jgi:hypothetical protein
MSKTKSRPPRSKPRPPSRPLPVMPVSRRHTALAGLFWIGVTVALSVSMMLAVCWIAHICQIQERFTHASTKNLKSYYGAPK